MQKAPTSITVGRGSYNIKTDFRVAIQFELLMQNNDFTDEEKLVKAIDLFLYEIPPDLTLEETIEKIVWFYSCGIKSKKTEKSTSQTKNIYSFKYDGDYIYAAFLEQYSIDLHDIPYLHWWKFKALFQALKADTEIVKIMGYRSIEIDSNMSSEQKRFYQKMKKLHELPINDSEDEKLTSIEEALISGKNIDNLL